MKRSYKLVGALISAALLTACAGNNGLGPSTPMSVAPQMAAPPTGVRSELRHATSGANLYVLNNIGNSVTVYAPGSKKVLRTILFPEGNTNEALAFDGSGNLYVGRDTTNSEEGWGVMVYESGTDTLLRTILDGITQFPTSLAFDGSGNLYVACFYGDVAVYAPGKTKPLRRISDGVSEPAKLVFDSSGNLYVANYYGSSYGLGEAVTVYAPGKTSVLRAITQGVYTPDALEFDSSGNLYVLNVGNPDYGVRAPSLSTPPAAPRCCGQSRCPRTSSRLRWRLTAPTISTSQQAAPTRVPWAAS